MNGATLSMAVPTCKNPVARVPRPHSPGKPVDGALAELGLVQKTYYNCNDKDASNSESKPYCKETHNTDVIVMLPASAASAVEFKICVGYLCQAF